MRLFCCAISSTHNQINSVNHSRAPNETLRNLIYIFVGCRMYLVPVRGTIMIGQFLKFNIFDFFKNKQTVAL